MKSLIAATVIVFATVGMSATAADAHPWNHHGWHHHRHCMGWGWHHHHNRFCRHWGW